MFSKLSLPFLLFLTLVLVVESQGWQQQQPTGNAGQGPQVSPGQPESQGAGSHGKGARGQRYQMTVGHEGHPHRSGGRAEGRPGADWGNGGGAPGMRGKQVAGPNGMRPGPPGQGGPPMNGPPMDGPPMGRPAMGGPAMGGMPGAPGGPGAQGGFAGAIRAGGDAMRTGVNSWVKGAQTAGQFANAGINAGQTAGAGGVAAAGQGAAVGASGR